jgi:glycosyltransferase involved in cell wall biosynthesis
MTTAAALIRPPAAPRVAAAVPLKRVLAITSNLEQASSRLRIAALAPLLREHGFDLDVRACPKSWAPRRELLRSASGYDAVILQRKLLDPWNWRVLRRHAQRVLFDVDDAVRFHPQRAGLYSILRTAMRFAATTRNVDRVVAGNPYLADMFRARGCEVSILPTAIDAELYQIKQHAPTPSPQLVWIGSRSTLPYLQQFMPTLERAVQRVNGLRLLVIADRTVTSRRIPVDHVPWSAHREASALVQGDIGIAPTPLDRWTLGKCGFKILQYMAAGLPVIASPVGANASLVRPDETGFAPEHADAWCDAIAKLAADCELRQRMGHAGRRLVKTRYRVEDAARTWADLLSE